MKKMLGLLAVVFALVSCEQPLVSVPAVETEAESRGITSAAAPVALLAETTESYYIYHGISGVNRVYKILVADLAFEKSVNIRFEMADGTWKDYPATFVADVNGNEELWEVKTSGTNGWGNIAFTEFGKKFAVNYTVNGTTYWDNNGGQNYTDTGYFLRSGTNVLRNANNGYNNNVLIRNLAFAKKVNVVYTVDGWATTKTSPAYFSYTVEGTNYEVWNWYINEYYGGKSIEYCFSYEVNGQTYWDNNFGKNYKN